MAAAGSSADHASFEAVAGALANVYDPEIGIDIVNLGLVYDIDFDEGVLVISMTLTTAACPLVDVIESSIADELDGIVDYFRVNWVWMPPWSTTLITEDGRDMLQALGVTLRSAA